MKQLLSFFLRKKIGETLFTERRYRFFTFGLLTAAAAFFVGFNLAYYYDFITAERVATEDTVLVSIAFFFAITVLLVDFFPVYRMNPYLFPNYYPISKSSKAAITFVLDIFRYYLALIVLSYLVFWYFSERFELTELFVSLGIVYCGYVLNRILKNIIEYSVPQGKLIAAAVLGAVAGYIWIASVLPLSHPIHFFGFTLCLGVSTTCYVQAEATKKVKSGTTARLVSTSGNFYLKIVAGSNFSRTYLYAFLFKFLWLLVTVLSLQKDGRPPFDNYGSVWMFASPLLLLLYAGINFFGYNKNLFFTHLTREGSVRILGKSFLFSMGILLLADSLLFWIFLLSAGLYNWSVVVFYYTAAIVLTIISYLFSLYRPVFTSNLLFFNTDKKKGSVFWGGIAVLLIVYFGIEQLMESDYQAIASAALISVAFAALLFLNRYGSSIVHNAYRQMRTVE